MAINYPAQSFEPFDSDPSEPLRAVPPPDEMQPPDSAAERFRRRTEGYTPPTEPAPAPAPTPPTGEFSPSQLIESLTQAPAVQEFLRGLGGLIPPAAPAPPPTRTQPDRPVPPQGFAPQLGPLAQRARDLAIRLGARERTGEAPAAQPAAAPAAEPIRSPEHAAAKELYPGLFLQPHTDWTGTITPHPAPFQWPTTRSVLEAGRPWWPNTSAQTNPGVATGNRWEPSPRESYRVMQEAARRLAGTTPPRIGGMFHQVGTMAAGFAPILDMLSGGKFSQNFQRANALQVQRELGRIKIQQQQMLEMSEQAEQAYQRMLSEYRRVFWLRNEDKITDDEARQRLTTLAQVNQDSDLIRMIQNNDLAGAAKFIEQQDADRRALQIANTVQRKATGTAEKNLDDWGDAAITPKESGRNHQYPNLPGPPGMPQGESAATRPAMPPGDDAQLVKEGYGPREIQAIHDFLNNRENPSYELAKKGAAAHEDPALRRINSGIARAQKHVDDIAQNEGLSPEEKQQQLDAYDKQLGDQVRGLYHYELDPHDDKVGNRRKMASLTRQIYKDYDAGNFANVHKYSNPDSGAAKSIDRARLLPKNTLVFLDTLKDVNENTLVPNEVVKSWVAGHLTGDPTYDKIYKAAFNVGQDVEAISSFSSGVPRVQLVKAWMEKMAPTRSLRSLRGQILEDVRNSYTVLNGYQEDWQKKTHRGTLVPGLDPTTFIAMRSLVRMNADTQQVPSDSPFELRAVNKDPSLINKRLKPEERLPPLTMKQIYQLQEKIGANMDSPDPELRAQAVEAWRRIGPVIDLGQRVPGVDPPLESVR